MFEVFVGNNYFGKEQLLWTILSGAFELIDVSTYIVAIYVSLSIDSLIYEKYCFCCHNAIYSEAAAQNAIRNNNGYALMMEPHHSHHANERNSQSSSRRTTNYFG